MISIFATTRYHDFLRQAINKEDRLHELVQIIDPLEQAPIPSGEHLQIKEDDIWPILDWYNRYPPYLLAERFPLTEDSLLGFVFAHLGNWEKAAAYLQKDQPALWQELDWRHQLQLGKEVASDQLLSDYSPFDEYRLMHNQAIVRHYSHQPTEETAERIKYFYLEALQAAPDGEHRAFTAKHFGQFLLDEGNFTDAARVLELGQKSALSAAGQTELLQARCQLRLQQLSPPYDTVVLAQLQADLQHLLTTYEKQGRPTDQALVWLDAGLIAHYLENWSEGLGYYNLALTLFTEEEQTELAASTN